MRKDIEWLREEVDKLEEWTIDAERFADQALEDVRDLINQLDEPEITLDKAFEKVAESYPMTKEEIWLHLERLVAYGGQVTYGELNEPEVLSYEWIIKNQERKGVHFFVNVTKLQNLLVPKQPFGNSEELPVIPKFVAEWIEEERCTMSNWKLPSRFISDSKYKKDQRRYKWSQVEGNMDKFMSALINGYEVEVEQRYYVMNNDQRMMLVRMMDGKTITEADPFKLEDMYEVEKKSHLLTEQEIKDYDPRYWAFAKPVEELEE